MTKNKKCLIGGTKPVLYLSANMRSVMLPADTQAGSVIYRLRASDADDQYPISFGVVGESGSVMSDISHSYF